MRMVQESKVTQLTYLPVMFPVNCYLVEEDEGLTLVDAALPNNVGAILAAAERIGKTITRIVLTHAHGDHVGALDGLKERLPEAKVYISERDAKLLRGDASLEEGEGTAPIRGGIPKGILTKPDVLLRENDRIGSLSAIAVPGHTPGSMAFRDERSGIVIAGDAFQTRGGVAVAGHMKLTFPFPAMATWNAAASLESARKLAALKPSVLAIGHGNMLSSPVQAMEHAIRAAEANLKKKGLIRHVT
ncbi:MBL fold metallo-hydrolase [Paenibacillus soyae]|uniref:MBL fold metallo-hydrolase n=1 Tax=Paenibacillus soyae TaxID=2969249 RepID=A0A9X2MSJ9_9BACL|nr:MBL fold metallo-hydrolase [Paenibacillus soyae]MCR2806156.1 MBL fold metallo-hydrolase [Paenibacillus soyae]